MLRIETEQQGDTYTITLHGSVADQWVPLLERHWRSIADNVPAANVTTVLSDVVFIDWNGERLLERMWRRGVDLVATGCLNRHVVDRIQRRGRRPEDGASRPRNAERG
jgi:hypothetical protein